MKAFYALFAVLFSAQVAAECADINKQNTAAKTHKSMRVAEARPHAECSTRAITVRQAYLNSFKPEPLAQEQLEIDLEKIDVGFVLAEEPYTSGEEALVGLSLTRE